MATNKNDRLAPPLMFAFRAAHEKRDAKEKVDLRDEGGERVIAARRTTGRAPISESGLRREVSSDLLNLFNTVSLASIEDLSDCPEVNRSVLNYGFPDLAWRSIDENSIHEVSREIEQALADFEPRLDRSSLKAQRDPSIAEGSLQLRFLVKGDLRTQPIGVPISFIAEIELDTGKVKVERL